MNIYEEERGSLYELFGKLDCRFNFISDIWTNKSKDRGFMALTYHYIDDTWTLRKKIINFIFLSSPHTGCHTPEIINRVRGA
jgi:hypothetical protein